MQVYFRKNNDNIDEFDECGKHFLTVDCRTKLLPNNDTVICRYSALPFNKELSEDLHNLKLSPINNVYEHYYIAGMEWYDDIKLYTFPTYFNIIDIPESAYPLVIKGKTNSRKFEWDTKMFAKDKKEVYNITSELLNDPLIGTQGLVYRQYVPLETYEIGINSIPMTNEWRCFFYKGILVDYGYYWACLDDLDKINSKDFEETGLYLAYSVAQIIKEHTNFYVIDIAKDINGKWWVVEINDGQMSGLSTIPIERFYYNLKRIVNR